MRPINLLPEGERPAAAAKAVQGSSVAVIAALSVLLLAAVGYVLSANQVDERTASIAQAQADTEAARAQVGALGPFQRFAAIKATRLASVQQLAAARFDWERLMREIALVLPEGSSLAEATASATGAEEDGAVADPALAGAPTVKLVGCATSQRQVATLLVRLRQLNRATDVTLANSAAQEEALSADGTDSQGDAVAPGEGTAASGCAINHLDFDATVVFAPDTAAAPDDAGAARAPARLGGGS